MLTLSSLQRELRERTCATQHSSPGTSVNVFGSSSPQRRAKVTGSMAQLIASHSKLRQRVSVRPLWAFEVHGVCRQPSATMGNLTNASCGLYFRRLAGLDTFHAGSSESCGRTRSFSRHRGSGSTFQVKIWRLQKRHTKDAASFMPAQTNLHMNA